MPLRLSGQKSPTIFYITPDYDKPSWGIGILYHHVDMLRAEGFDAVIVHNKAPFRLDWLDLDVPIRYLDQGIHPRRRDILVVPEITAGRGGLLKLRCRRFVFVQNSYLMLTKLDTFSRYDTLGYERAMTIMPHIQQIIKVQYGLPAAIIPPFVAPYFFIAPENLHHDFRRRQIVIYPKPGSQDDYDILSKVLKHHLESVPGWELVELSGYSHRETAALLQESMFFVSLNTREAFNTSVPEAMAAGCIPVCYEAFGGQDNLRDGENAYVFPNNYIYPLIEKLLDLIDHYDSIQDELARMRENAFETASHYTWDNTREALLAFFKAEIR
ncbi:MAG: glycosyltransferase family 4 protein [Anaerolineae bacterium]|nr:glycosyltransferase family 4 protein [Anaerolineae bacterium]